MGRAAACFNHNHFFLTVAKHFHSYRGNFYRPKRDTTHIALLDFCSSLDAQIDQIRALHLQGIKVFVLTHDPANFPRIDNFIRHGCIDTVFVFDRQYENRFAKTQYIDDFVNEDLFPAVKATMKNNEFCYFGHLQCGRKTDIIFRHLKTGSLRKLYRRVARYKGAIIFSSGLSEDLRSITHYTKAKFLEALMSGTTPYCEAGINNTRYQRYIKRFSDRDNIFDVDLEDVRRLNRQTIEELVQKIKAI